MYKEAPANPLTFYLSQLNKKPSGEKQTIVKSELPTFCAVFTKTTNLSVFSAVIIIFCLFMEKEYTSSRVNCDCRQLKKTTLVTAVN